MKAQFWLTLLCLALACGRLWAATCDMPDCERCARPGSISESCIACKEGFKIYHDEAEDNYRCERGNATNFKNYHLILIIALVCYGLLLGFNCCYSANVRKGLDMELSRYGVQAGGTSVPLPESVTPSHDNVAPGPNQPEDQGLLPTSPIQPRPAPALPPGFSI